MSSEYYPPYLPLSRAYPRPSTGGMSHLGWWHQLAHNTNEMRNAIDIFGSSSNNLGWIVDGLYLQEGAHADWADVTVTAFQGDHGHIRVGQVCWFWAWSNFSALGATQVTVPLPVPPARSVLPMTSILAHIEADTQDWHHVVGRFENERLALYDISGPLNSSTWGSSGKISVAGAYRCEPAPAWRLTDRTRRVEKQAGT